jgi:transcriptional regulator with XRE-family HTH domain
MSPSKTKIPLHQRLRKARLRAGLTQATTAELVGTTREYLNRVERGAQRSPETQVKLARALNVRVSVADLFPEDAS